MADTATATFEPRTANAPHRSVTGIVWGADEITVHNTARDNGLRQLDNANAVRVEVTGTYAESTAASTRTGAQVLIYGPVSTAILQAAGHMLAELTPVSETTRPTARAKRTLGSFVSYVVAYFTKAR